MSPKPARAPSPENGDIVEGPDGWLFLTGGSNRALALYHSDPDPQTAAWAALLTRRAERLGAMGVEYRHLVAPEKLSVYGDLIGVDGTLGPGRKLESALTDGAGGGLLVNPLAFFARARRDYLLYWKTDTHWSPWGCFAAYQLLCSAIGVAARPDLLARPFTEGEIALDLGARYDPHVTETARFYDLIRDARRTDANAVVRFKEENALLNEQGLHVGSRVVFRNDAPSAIDRCVVLFGDSFCEYRPHLLTGMLAETFRETHFLWSASIDFGYVARVGATLVLTELAERFMSATPPDDVDFERMAEDRLAAWRAAA